VIPDIINQLVVLFKSTSVVSIIAVPDLMYQANVIVNDTYVAMQTYTLVALTYFLIVFGIAAGAARREAHSLRRPEPRGPASCLSTLPEYAAMIEIRGLCKSFGATPVLKGIDLCMAAGSTVAVIGESGSGKSTLVRCINISNGSTTARSGWAVRRPCPAVSKRTAGRARSPASGRGSAWCFRTSTCFRI
jgi:ABC-type multidrug transport system fused ATPase/permease subunit